MRFRNDYGLMKRKMASGKVVYYYWIYDSFGKRVYRSTGEKTKAMADKHVRKLLEEGTIGARERSLIKLKDYAENFFIPGKCPIEKYNHSRGRSMTRSTLSIRRTAMVEHIFPHLGNTPIYFINYATINKWLIELPETDHVSRTTANTYKDTLRCILGQAVRDGIISKNPCIGVESLGNDTKIRKAFNLKEARAIIGTPEDWKNPLVRSMCILAATTGMRMGEIRALRAENLYVDTVVIKASYSNIDGYKLPKNGKERMAPLPPGVYEEVTRFTKRSGYLFRLFMDDKPVSAGWVDRALNERMKELGIEGKTFHSFRGFFNTQMLSANVNSESLRAVIGHASEAMTLRYLHMDAADFPEFRKAQEELVNEILA